MLIHSPPAWDDCQQLGRGEEVVASVLGANGLPTQVQVDIDAVFPLIQLDWNSNPDGGRERLRAYHQILMGGLREAAQGKPGYPRQG